MSGGVGYLIQRESQPLNIAFGASNVGIFNTFGLAVNDTAATSDTAFKVGGRVTSSGSVASMNFQDRAGGAATYWAWYSSGTIARLNHDPEGDRITVDTSGNITAVGGITVGGGQKLSKITLGTAAPGALAAGELYLRY
ncbi:hypothetical protein ACFQZQ_02815 [Lysobacter koreensis]|uniref:Uncharacterized protein n=1 Tax=Lysobacter koreensis TaxID=266122 RepID=A0ABW2YK44_9GAMM